MKEFLTNLLEDIKTKINAGQLLLPHLKKLDSNTKISVISIGKAANEMAKSSADFYNQQIENGLIICPDNSNDYQLNNFERLKTSHPLPDQRSLNAASKLINFLKDNQTNYLIFLISGGASSLVELPIEGISLEDYNEIINQLILSDTDINQINAKRKELSQIKGGKLLKYLNPYNAHAFILSDIYTGEIHNVGSGLTFDQSSEATAPSGIPYTCIGDNNLMLNIIKNELEINNIPTLINPYPLSSIASICGLNLGCIAYRYNDKKRPLAVLFGGECTVNVTHQGTGGRCQEIALALACEIQNMQNVSALVYASDGKDGNSPASGAIIDSKTYDRIKLSGHSAEYYLKRNKSYSALKFANDIIPEHPSTTNLNDVVILLFY